MISIDDLPKIVELGKIHDALRARLVKLRSGDYEAVLTVYRHPDGDGNEDGERIHLNARQGAGVVCGLLTDVRANLQKLGVNTPNPPSIAEADR